MLDLFEGKSESERREMLAQIRLIPTSGQPLREFPRPHHVNPLTVKTIVAEPPQAVAAASRKVADLAPEERTRTITKAMAANLHHRGKIANASAYIRRQVTGRLMAEPLGSGQSWQFALADFPVSAQEKLR